MFKQIVYTSFFGCMFSITAFHPSYSCEGPVKNTKLNNDQNSVFSNKEGNGFSPVAVRVVYDIDEKSEVPKMPLSVFIDLSGSENSGQWEKIGDIIPFGPNNNDEKNAVVSVPQYLKEILNVSTGFPIAIAYGEKLSTANRSNGIKLQSATVILD